MERLSAPISSSTTRRLPNGGSNFKEDQSLCGGKGDGGGEDSYKIIRLFLSLTSRTRLIIEISIY